MTMPPPGQWPPSSQVPPPQYWGPPHPPPKGGKKTKWVLGGLAILAIVIVTVAATLFFTGEGADNGSGPHSTATTDGSGPSSSNSPAAAEQVAIITSEPTCGEWNIINDALAAAENSGWGDRDPSLPASAWRPDQLAQFRAVGVAMRTAADQAVPLARRTPNRMVGALYEQFTAYARAYADRIPVLEAGDDHLARVTVGLTGAISSICNAIAYGSAESRANLVNDNGSLQAPYIDRDPDSASMFLTSDNAVCPQISDTIKSFSDATAAWRNIDPSIPSSNWSADQKKVNDDVIPVMSSFAESFKKLGDRSGNPRLDAFATLAAVYRQAFASAIPTYLPPDNFLNEVAAGLAGAINEACYAIGG
ncbi:hypothetical protein GR927_13865 [Mycolicibacterium sp. 3033]|nr:hypothetical protein [Mycolicibacterium aurantiacum]